MDAQKQQIADRVKTANNILVTVSANPSVDQLAACIGLTLAFTKLGKHATAVFSGAVPSTIEFLQPEKTIEKNTDSLRDFIIALDKSKADKLRYKVEDKVVKIFITPYRTSLGESDLEFSQGDFNIDVVIALGIHNPADVDQAITAHGRILHDAAVATLNIKPGGELGGINWLDTKASSLCELVMQLIGLVDKRVLDPQIATALLTGIVAETQRFSNAKTTPQTMSLSAELMSAGANQQLVVTKLEPPKPIATAPVPIAQQPFASAPAAAQPAPQGAPLAQSSVQPAAEKKPEDGTLQITHNIDDLNKSTEGDKQEGEDHPEEAPAPQINIDTEGMLHRVEAAAEGAATTSPTDHMASSHMVLQPPTMGGQLTANSTLGGGDAPSEFSNAPIGAPILQHGAPAGNTAPGSLPMSAVGGGHTYLDPNAMPLSVPTPGMPDPNDTPPSGSPYAPPESPMPGVNPIAPTIEPLSAANADMQPPTSSAPPLPPPMMPA